MATPRRLISLTQAAEDLGVHYMTAYRYVRTGRLPAQKSGHEWLVDEADVLAMREPEPTPGPRRGRRADYPRRLEDRLLAADETGAWTVVEQALGSGMEPADLYLEVLAPAMASVGERWANGEIPVSSEHRASATALRLIGRLGPRFARRGRKRGTVIVGAPPGDAHALPSAIARDLLRGRSYAVIDLGSDVPAEDWALLADTTEGLT
ncbi:MAG: B12-binding domain-containing protein, partial [Acidimicrobiales bacterium]|nr:B12-binding domain-containing protein [Acidimicrobiales bacterium]